MRSPIIFSALLALAIVGCSTTGKVVTPDRVEAVVALGTYLGGKNLVTDGRRAEVERSLLALQTIQGSGSRDMVAIAAALSASGLTFLETPEGMLAFGVLESVFQDKYGPEVILENEWADAVLIGAVRGLNLALSAQKSRPPDAPSIEAMLTGQAKSTRQ